MADAVPGRVRGIAEAKAAFQRMPEVLRDYLNAATELTVREGARFAQGRLLASPSIRTRALYNAVGWSINRKTGRGRFGVRRVTTTLTTASAGRVRVKGVVVPGRNGSALISQGAKVIKPTRYAHLVEFGTRHSPAEPFMVPAARDQKQPYLDRCKHAGKMMEKDVSRASGSSRLL